MNLTASLIVKNELGRYLKPCIAHLLYFCDSIVVVDDGSTDGTVEWLTDAGIYVVQLPESEGFFDGHEGRRRQFLLEETVKLSPDWVLAIDADEFVSDGNLVRAFVDTAQRPLGTLLMEEVWKAPPESLSIRIDGGWRAHPIPCLYRASALSTRQARIADRELACGREPEVVRRWAARGRPTGASILHFGWAKESGRRARYERYVTADGGRFHRNAHLDSIMLPDTDVSLDTRPWPEGLEGFRHEISEAAA